MIQSDWLFLFSIVACIISISTFVASMKSRASNDGMMMQKLEQALKGIDELKTDVKSMSQTERTLELQVQSHEEQLKNIFSMMKNDDVQTQSLMTICEILRQIYHSKEE